MQVLCAATFVLNLGRKVIASALPGCNFPLRMWNASSDENPDTAKFLLNSSTVTE